MDNMSSSVCQGLQSCLEPRLVEPRVLIQNLAPPKFNFSQSIPWPQKPNVSQPQQERNQNIHNEDDKNITINKYYSFVDTERHESNKEDDLVWSSIQAFTKTCQHYNQLHEAEQIYVHPLVKHSSSTLALSTKSLEMCTESLGSETGSSIDESIDDFPSPLLERPDSEGIQPSRSRGLLKKLDRAARFPPPLTSISGGVQVRPHREGGRLVLKAVTVSSCGPYFQAERANGRLRLSLLKDGYADSNHIDCGEIKENAYNLKLNEEDDEQENGIADGREEVESEDEDNSVEDDATSSQWEDEKVGYGTGVGEFQRPSRCKEGGMPTWGPSWVAIS